MIWTTTPWTLPANLAIAVNPRFEYALAWIDGNVTVLAKDAVERVTRRARSEEVVVIATTTGDRLVGLRYRHPFVAGVPAFPKEAGGDPGNCYKLVPAEYVTLEDGTGLVHTAPGHGAEDYQTGLKERIPVYCPVLENGSYDQSVPEWLRGVDIWKANGLVVQRLRQSGHMFHDHVFTHSYPHDWRSKTPVIFRCTEQWFVSVEGSHQGHTARADAPNLRALALAAVDEHGPEPVRFVPEWGRNRMRGMLESRPDWCVSRQRAWGLPIPAFFLPDGVCFMTAASVRAVARVFAENGSDAWFTAGAGELLRHYDPAGDPDAPASLRADPGLVPAARKGDDILDVWFESGSSWNSVMRARGLGYPIDLYLEGSDQHRGWFQLSMLPALGVTGRPPFRTLLTHGFIVDKDGKKLSKSRPDAHLYEVERLSADFGSDVLRWWVSSLSYENDVKMDREYFNVAGESYRKIRNTLRFMLSNLYDHAHGAGAVPPAAPSMDAWVLGEFDRLRAEVIGGYEAYDFRSANQALYDFCNATLSATYLAAVKDRLYCDRADAPRRRATQATLAALTDGLCRLLAPVLCHTADEAFRALRKSGPDDASRCVHLELFPAASGAAPHPAWSAFFAARDQALGAMEQAKARLGVENPLDMGVTLPDPEGLLAALDPHDLADLLGVSRVRLDRAIPEPRIADLREEPRCERSWKRDATVRRRSDGGMLSDRDAAALGLG
jgi:isoleucyl-tRNA synthetase